MFTAKPQLNCEFIASIFRFKCGKCPPVTIVIQARLSLLCALHLESQWEENVHGHCFPEDRLAARAINYNRQGDRQTDRQTVPQRAQTGPGSWSRPDKYKETRGEQRARPRGTEKINPAAAARLHRLPDNVLLQSGIKTSLCHKRQSDARRR